MLALDLFGEDKLKGLEINKWANGTVLNPFNT